MSEFRCVIVASPADHRVAVDVFEGVVERKLALVPECAVVVGILGFPVADLLAVGRDRSSYVVAFRRCGIVEIPFF
jgi:hypothetical protein